MIVARERPGKLRVTVGYRGDRSKAAIEEYMRSDAVATSNNKSTAKNVRFDVFTAVTMKDVHLLGCGAV
jgi:hypothetical protein